MLGLLVFLGGCGTTYDTRFYYQPRPVIAEIELERDGGTAVVARGVAAVIGLRHADEEAGLPRSVEVRLRIENESEEIITFDPQTLIMYDAGAQRLENPIVHPAGEAEIPPAESITVRAFFPYDEELDDVSGLALRWSVQVDGQQTTASAHFSRRVRPSYRSRHHYGSDYGWHPHHHHFGFGFGVHRGYCY